MQYALSRHSLESLRRFVTPRTALAFDFDGTLAPIVNHPERARMRSTTRLLLRKVAAGRTCLALSGRSREDLRGKLAGAGIGLLIGNHGVEIRKSAASSSDDVRQWEQALRQALPELPGMWIENKALSLTVHYRECGQKTKAHSAILAAAGALTGVRLVGGKQAVSIVSEDAPNKGGALKAALARLKCNRALYVGDEETDEDVFALSGRQPFLFTIRVSREQSSRADYFLRNQKEIDDLLRFLLELPAGN